jgi:RNA polymerase sigma factor (sigma-70 family)
LLQLDPPEDIERRCRVVVDQLLARYEWGLLRSDELVRRALLRARAGLADHLPAAIVGAYCVALHAACSGAEGAARQNRAYAELAHYLYSLTCQRYGDLSLQAREDAVQSALERIFTAFDNCREPVAFLAFAAQHLLDAVRAVRRRERRVADSLEREWDEDADEAPITAPDEQPQPLEQVIAGERREAIEHLLREFLRDHPRAAQQVAVLRMTWIDDLDDEVVGQQLGISLNSVYVARSRIIKTIQSEPKWQARAGELGILSDEV